MLTDQAIAIWQAGVAAVSSEALVARVLRQQAGVLSIHGESFPLADLDRIVIVGAGKAGAGMAAACEAALGPELLDAPGKVCGWVNVPADCVRPLRRVVLHPGRPAGLNEPTADGVFGATRILKLVESMSDRDLCLVLISGGGSALLPAPIDGISLEDKQAVTRVLSTSGATIQELNTVRKRLSRIKGGGLSRACRHGRLIALIISDVIGDPLDVIASGPTVPDTAPPEAALAILRRLVPDSKRVPASVWQALEASGASDAGASNFSSDALDRRVTNHVIGRNAMAVEAAAERATALGFEVEVQGTGLGGEAAPAGRELARRCLAELSQREVGGSSVRRPKCFLSGGEPVVKLAATDRPRKGGRNQELVLAAFDELAAASETAGRVPAGLVILSGGTDGEDGPTDAAGAWLDANVAAAARAGLLDHRAFLAINDSYSFFEACGGLLKTGPTHTNVMDLRVALLA